MQSAILGKLAPRFDPIVEAIYRAGSGVEPWLNPIAQVAEVFDAWSVQLLGLDKRKGLMSFSFESGSAPGVAQVEYLRYYHRIDPRLGKHVLSPVGEWFSCEKHFDEAFVSTDPFYQDYLIPMGGRYQFSAKLHDDEYSTVRIGHLSRIGNPPLTLAEKAAFSRISAHIRRALDIQRLLDEKSSQPLAGFPLLENMRQPMMLIDHRRTITYCNRNAIGLLARKDFVCEVDGQLACRDADSDHALGAALHEMELLPTAARVARGRDRHSLRLKRKDGRSAAATLLALRPESTLGSFGRTPQALFTLFEAATAVDVDPFLLSITFDLTPAESRLAVKVVNGHSTEDCARELNVKISTVRSQLVSIYAKTGATGQADLVRMVLSATAL